MAEPSPARLAVQGFTQLATWYAQLVGDHVAGVARAAADGRLDADAAAAAWTRTLALPFIGMTALVNEVVDAASLQAVGVQRHRSIESDVFVAAAPGQVAATPSAPPANGFGERLANVDVELVPGDGVRFKLVARAVPDELVGVFRSTVTITDTGGGRHEQPVWLVVP
jgi:hypothetical protein